MHFQPILRASSSVLKDQNRRADSCFDAFSSREPVSTSLENALKRRLGGGPGHHVPRDEQPADQRAGQAGAGPPPGEGRDHGGYRQKRHELDRHNSGERNEARIGQRVEQLPVNHSVPYFAPKSTMKPNASAKILVK